MHITIKVVSPNPTHGRVYSIQHYVIKFVSDFRQVVGFPTITLVFFTNKTDGHDITKILLKVVLSTITLTHIPLSSSNRSLVHSLFHYKIIGFYSVFIGVSSCVIDEIVFKCLSKSSRKNKEFEYNFLIICRHSTCIWTL